TCPGGVATQDPVLRQRFAGKPEHVVNYLFMVAEEARRIMAQLGFRTMDEMIGRLDVLETSDAVRHLKADGLDLTPILQPAVKRRDRTQLRCTVAQTNGLERELDNHLPEITRPASESGERVVAELPVVNLNRTVGTLLSHHVAK